MTKHLRTMTVAMLLTACSIVSNATEANTYNQLTPNRSLGFLCVVRQREIL